MIADQIRTLFDYNEWAWKQVFSSVEKLDDPVYKTKRPLFSETSLHDLLVHSLAAESIWLSRCLGFSPTALFNPDEYADFTAVTQHWAVIRDDWSNFLRGLSDEDLSRVVEYRNTRGGSFSMRLVDVLQHVINHATEHRSQITPILYQLDAPTQPLDYMWFRIRPS